MRATALAFCLVALCAGCNRGPDRGITGSGLQGNFSNPTNILGKPSVRVVSQTPASIQFRYNTTYVNLNEVTGAAQQYCSSSKKNAELQKDGATQENGQSIDYVRIALFRCVN